MLPFQVNEVIKLTSVNIEVSRDYALNIRPIADESNVRTAKDMR